MCILHSRNSCQSAKINVLRAGLHALGVLIQKDGYSVPTSETVTKVLAFSTLLDALAFRYLLQNTINHLL